MKKLIAVVACKAIDRLEMNDKINSQGNWAEQRLVGRVSNREELRKARQALRNGEYEDARDIVESLAQTPGSLMTDPVTFGILVRALRSL